MPGRPPPPFAACAALSLGFAAVAPAVAEEGARPPGAAGLAGCITSDAGEQLNGVSVQVTELSTGLQAGTWTDREGCFELTPLPPGSEYVLWFELEEFALLEVSPLEVLAGEVTRADYSLTPAKVEVTYLIGGRVLDGEELHRYVDMEEYLEARLEGVHCPAIDLVAGLVGEIADLPAVVGEPARRALRGTVWKALIERAGTHDPLIQAMFASGDPDLQGMAVDVVLHQGAWLADTAFNAQLRDLLRSSATDASVRTRILGLFVVEERFEEVRGDALALAADTGDAELARESARMVAWDAEQNGGPGQLHRLFEASTGLLREEAALWLAAELRWTADALPVQIEDALVLQLIDIALDPTAPPWTRGRAIETSGRFAQDPRVVAALVELLEPEQWFFGAPGAHAPRHSLEPVLELLRDARDPELPYHLLDLCARLHLLDDEARIDVSRAARCPPGEDAEGRRALHRAQ